MIHSLRLQQYRCYNDDSFEFSDGVNIVVGPNASGKTNLLEALIVSASGKSYKSTDGELIRHGEAWARVDAHSGSQHRTVKVQEAHPRANKTIELDNVTFSRLSPQRQLAYVLFEPNDLLLLHGGPERRREYIDSILDKLIAPFASIRRDYRRTLAQRNRLLKQGDAKPDDLFVWDVRLSELGGKIASQRQELISKINPKLTKTYQKIAGTDVKVTISYESKLPSETYSTAMHKTLQNNVHTDTERGYTSAGPHRDDIKILFDSYDGKEVASRGETRTVVLALKIIELELLMEAKDQKPILLLDDVFSELDGARRKHLTDYLKTHQTFITTTDADIVVQHFMKKCHIIPLG